MKGEFAGSVSGHDKGRIYVIIEEHEDSVMLCDGKHRTLDRLKKKNRKHVQIVKRHIFNEVIIEKLSGGEEVTDEEIKRAIRLYCRERGNDSILKGDRTGSN
ncbi:MAG TPA: hypothetical protein DCL38_06735 [Lachnospiraceae bacterium]|nr:hypothetical protein [Lachnospiraceae bacterium]